MINPVNEFLIKKYIKNVLNVYHKEHTSNKDKHNLRCNICGDSVKSKHKKRGWFLDYKGKYIFKCFNCGSVLLAEKWLKEYYPEYHIQYIQESLILNNTTFKVEKKDEKKEKKKEDNKDIKYFKSIKNNKNNSIIQSAIKICEERQIPKVIYEKWYVAIDGKYKNRIIISIFDKNNKIAYWQARSINNKKQPKYLNCLRSTDDAINAQLELIDKNKPIIVVEGYIDSIFIENCIATMSTNWSDDIQNKLDSLDVYYLIDYDKDNKEVRKRKLNLLFKNKNIFNWYKYLKEQNIENREKWDINDLFIFLDKKERFKFDYFKPFFTNNIMDKIYF